MAPDSALKLADTRAGTRAGTGASDEEVDAFTRAHADVQRIEVLIPDTNGTFRGKWMPADHLPSLFRDGLSLAKSVFSLDAWGRDVPATGLYEEVGDRDGIAVPVPGTLKRVPWAEPPTGQVVLRMLDEDGTPFFADPRTRLEAVTGRLAARGYRATSAFELEFYLLRPRQPGEPPEPVFAGAGPERTHTYQISDLRTYKDLLGEIETAARALDLPVDTVVSEAATGQFEINLLHGDDCIRVADDALMLRRVVTGVAEKHGLAATFMAKPFMQRAGNGTHLHASLCDGEGINIFGVPDSGEDMLRRAVAGTLATMSDATLMLVSTVNGFRRLSGPYTPSSAHWGENNRYVSVRLPRAPARARRFEHRTAGADANPMLVMACVLAGLDKGLDGDCDLPLPVTGDIADVSAKALPRDFANALERFEASDWVADYFGADYQRFYAAVKRQEWQGFQDHIPMLEYETYL